MESQIESVRIDRRSVEKTGGWIAPVIVLLVTTLVYGAIFFRDDSIPTAIGANLVPAERILKGEVPYRDFYKIQTPGILLFNAALFKLAGTNLFNAMFAVMVFKVLTILMVFLIARRTGTPMGALCAVILAMIWLAPGGPFRPAPIQYEMLFIVVAIYFAVRWSETRLDRFIFVAGLAVGMVAVFKQNTGVYAAIALLVLVFLIGRQKGNVEDSKEEQPALIRWELIASAGISVPLGLMVYYLFTVGALNAAIDVFIRAPGEHIESRLTGYPAPKEVIVVMIVASIGLIVASKVASKLTAKWPNAGFLVDHVAPKAAGTASLFVPHSFIDNSIYWFSPALFVFAGWIYLRNRHNVANPTSKEEKNNTSPPGRGDRSTLLILLLFALAAYGEVFPRSVRGLVIGALPPAILLLVFLIDSRVGLPKVVEEAKAAKPWLSRRVALLMAWLVMIAFAIRLEGSELFVLGPNNVPRFKADTELSFDRGRGIYLPASRASEVDATVEFIRSRVPEGEYFFAHALDASNYYFLAARNSPTGATLWNDTGTNDRERARTLEALQQKNVCLILTSEQAMNAEPYRPLLDFMNSNFHALDMTIGKMIFLERNY